MFSKFRALLIRVATFFGFFRPIFPAVCVVTKSSIPGEPLWIIRLWPGLIFRSKKLVEKQEVGND